MVGRLDSQCEPFCITKFAFPFCYSSPPMCITESTREADTFTDSHIRAIHMRPCPKLCRLKEDYDRAQRSQTPYTNV